MITELAKSLTISLLLTVVLVSGFSVFAWGIISEEDGVFNYLNELPYGNWTFTRRPATPMMINSSQISIGANWTYVYTLTANHTYHVYCFGNWIEEGPDPVTDYDIYVYNPLGELEGYHTETAGLPEHLGTTVEEPFFTPEYSGNYSFVIRNDPRESQAADSATLMVIEHVKTNIWYNCSIEGKQGNISTVNTCWAYEFITSSENIEIQIRVPDSLDMYEARLYLMTDQANNELLNGVPLAWEPGLYGEVGDSFGGYNLDSKSFRGNAYASCEYYGQDMLINYTALFNRESLYHLVFIGETGAGDLSFRIKTDFGSSDLRLETPIQSVYPNNDTIINAVSTNSNIQSAFLYYSLDSWKSFNFSNMIAANKTCNASIPGQKAGTIVSYRVEAFDFLDNLMILNGSYTVKHPSFVEILQSQEVVTIGENISLNGYVRPGTMSARVQLKLIFTSPNSTTVTQFCDVQEGNFSASFKPFTLGSWTVQAEFLGDQMRHAFVSSKVYFNVVDPPFFIMYSMYIYAGIGVAVGFMIVIMFIRRRQS